MKILPPSLAPWRGVIERRHDPPVARKRYGYRTYRTCLRWEFGFTCPFCLCHEADFAPRGAEGLGVTQIEHFVPVSHDEAGINIYLNCFYVCIFCNQARRATRNVDPADGRRLLNPCTDVWAEHFVVSGDGIEARERGGDGAYTHAAYHLNDPRKVERRCYRRETIEECLELLDQGPSILASLLERAAVRSEPELVDEAKLVGNALRRAWRDLGVFEVEPQDAPSSCACSTGEPCSIPGLLEEQTVEIEPPVTSGRFPS